MTGVEQQVVGCIEQSIAARFEEQVRRWPQRPAVVTAEELLSYEALNARANGLAHAILAHGASPGQPVALLIDQSAWQVAAVLGVLKAGCWYAPLDERWPIAQLSQVVAELEPPIILYSQTNKALAITLTQASTAALALKVTTAESNPNNPGLAVAADNLAYIFYTSGSTGSPKGVIDNQRNVLHNVMRYTNSLGVTHTDGLTLLQHPSFSGAVSSLFCALLNGATVYPFDVRREGAFAIAPWLAAHPITIYHSVPSLFRQVAASNEVFPNLRIVRLEGDQATWQDAALFQKRFSSSCILVNGLGATECGIVRQFRIDATSAIGSFAGRVIETLPIGFGVEDMDIVLLDSNGGTIEPGEKEGSTIDRPMVGEIGVRSRYLALGYWRRPDLTAARFRPDPADPRRRIYLTGDMGRLTHVGGNARTSPGQELGILEYLGRKDSQVKVGGQWVDLAVVETAIGRIPGVREVAAVAERDATGETQIVAYFTEQRALGAMPALTPGDMRRFLLQAKRLPGFMIPARFVRIEALPLNRHGKVDRAALAAPRQDRSAQTTSVLPPNATEARLAVIWGELLGMETIGVFEDFFDLGGHSLLASQLVLRLRDEFGSDLTLRHLIEAPTIAALAARLDGHANSSALASQDSTPTPHAPGYLSAECDRDRHSASAYAGLPALLPIRTTGSRAPFFFLAGGGGGETEYFGAYAGLLARLGPDQPIYGFTTDYQQVEGRAPNGAGSVSKLPDSVAAISARCVAQMRAVQAHGPFFLGGECTGGKLALEIARLLRADGEEVALLVLLNTTLSAPVATLRGRLSTQVNELRSLPAGMRSHRIAALFQGAASRLPPVLPGWRPLHDTAACRRRYQDLLQTHIPAAYDGDVTLFLTSDRRSEAERWRTLITGALDVFALEGDAATYLGISARPVGERLAALLRSAHTATATPSE